MRSRRTIQIHVEFQYVTHPVVSMGYVKDQANVIVKWDGNGHLNIRDLLINDINIIMDNVLKIYQYAFFIL